jgi:hypothetical protein
MVAIIRKEPISSQLSKLAILSIGFVIIFIIFLILRESKCVNNEVVPDGVGGPYSDFWKQSDLVVVGYQRPRFG